MNRIRVGAGGWNYDPWRETFYPKDVPKARELHYASRQLTAIEVNGTFYRLQKPETFAKWRDETPDDFVFSLKAPRYLTNRKHLAEAVPLMGRFLESGLSELGKKLGPILWQLAPNHAFDAADLKQFLSSLPQDIGGRRMRHVLEARHASFMTEALIDLLRSHGVALVFADTDEHPSFAEATTDFVYARLMRSEAKVETGYPKAALEQWAARARLWAQGSEPRDVPRITGSAAQGAPRDVFLFFINGAKERAPAAARALIEILRS